MTFTVGRKRRLAFLLVAFLSAPVAQAERLEDLLPSFVQEHEKILAARANVEKARHSWEESKAALRPSIDMTLSQGYEKQLKPSPPDTKTNRNTEQLELSQLVYDWGGASAKAKASQMGYVKSRVTLELTQQNLLLQGTQAYLNLLKSVERLRYSQRSEANIKKQTGLEEARVKRGSGLSTDVLQTKSSLAGAMATRVRNEGAVVSAKNRFQATFHRDIALDRLQAPRIPYEKIPNTLAEAVAIAKRNSLKLKQAQLDVLSAQQSVRTAAAKIGPELKFKASAKHKHNDAGTLGTKEEYLAKIDLTMPIYAGGKNMAGLRKARQSLAASRYNYQDTVYTIEEQVRNAWQNLSTSRSNAQFLRNQANISGEFLDFARKERKLGTRSLLDVLNGETAYINALSSAVSAETDMAIAVFTLLQAMGELTTDVFVSAIAPTAENVVKPVVSPTAEAAAAAEAARRVAARLSGEQPAESPEAVAVSEEVTAPAVVEQKPEGSAEEAVEPLALDEAVAEVAEAPASITTPEAALNDLVAELEEAEMLEQSELIEEIAAFVEEVQLEALEEQALPASITMLEVPAE